MIEDLQIFHYVVLMFEGLQVTRQELEEADELCHGNWIEIQHQYEYILRLQELLTQHGIEIPPEY